MIARAIAIQSLALRHQVVSNVGSEIRHLHLLIEYNLHISPVESFRGLTLKDDFGTSPFSDSV